MSNWSELILKCNADEEVIKYKMVLSKVYLCKCLTKLQDKLYIDTIYLMFLIWSFTLIWLKPANVVQTSGTTPKLKAKPNGLYANKLFASMTTKITNHEFFKAEICFIWNRLHASITEFVYERSLLGKLSYCILIGKLENMVSKRSRFMAALMSTSFLRYQSTRLLGTDT